MISLSLESSQLIHRIRAFGAFIAMPSNLWLMVRMSSWVLVLPLLKHIVPLPSLAQFMWVHSPNRERRLEREHKIATLDRWIYGSNIFATRSNCLERSLLLYRFLSENNANPQLMVGLSKVDGEWKGHAWVLVDNRPFGELLTDVEGFVPLFVYGTGGDLVRLSFSGSGSL